MAVELRQIPRYGELAWFLWKHGGADLIDAGELSPEDLEKSSGESGPEAFARDLEKLGPTFIKLGQLLSTRGDLFPESYLKALERLQDDVEPIAAEVARQVFEDEIGVDVGKAFLSFDDEPLASASLAQVHRAVMRDGRHVAVKIQRPGMREQVLRDLKMLASVAELVDGRWDSVDLPAVVEDMRRVLLRELDYNEERDHLTRLRTQLAERRRLVVPRPLADFSSTRVLTMEFIGGRKITDLNPVALIDLDGEELARELFAAYLDNILVDGFFHADPHPGNVLLTDDHRIALIDLGMVAELAPSFREQLLQLLLAVSEGDSTESARAALRIGDPTENFDRPEFERRTGEIVQRVARRTVSQMQIGALVLEVERVARDTGVRLPPQFSMLGKTLLNLDRIAERLAPKFDPNAEIRRHAASVAQRQMEQSWSLGSLVSRAIEVKQLLEALPRRLNQLLETTTERGLRIQVDALDENLIIEGFQKVANRITAGLVIAALIVGAALIMRVETPWTLFGYPGLAIMLFLGAVLSGGVLLWRIVKHDR